MGIVERSQYVSLSILHWLQVNRLLPPVRGDFYWWLWRLSFTVKIYLTVPIVSLKGDFWAHFGDCLTHQECRKMPEIQKWEYDCVEICTLQTRACNGVLYRLHVFRVLLHILYSDCCVLHLEHPLILQWPYMIASMPNCWLCAECLPDDGMYFIVSPKDIVTARQRDEDDHITWLLEHEMFVVSCTITLLQLTVYDAVTEVLPLVLCWCWLAIRSVENMVLLQLFKDFLW